MELIKTYAQTFSKHGLFTSWLPLITHSGQLCQWWIPYVSFILLHSCDKLKKISAKKKVATDEGNSRNETWHWTNSEIGVAVES